MHMTRKSYAIVVIASLLSACAHMTSERGDITQSLGVFFSEHGIKVLSQPTPARQTIWLTKTEKNEVTIFMADNSITEIDAMMRQFLGQPDISEESNIDGLSIRVYFLKKPGVVIGYYETRKGIEMKFFFFEGIQGRLRAPRLSSAGSSVKRCCK